MYADLEPMNMKDNAYNVYIQLYGMENSVKEIMMGALPYHIHK